MKGSSMANESMCFFHLECLEAMIPVFKEFGVECKLGVSRGDAIEMGFALVSVWLRNPSKRPPAAKRDAFMAALHGLTT